MRHWAKPVVGAKDIVTDKLVLLFQLPNHRLRAAHQGQAVVDPEVVGSAHPLKHPADGDLPKMGTNTIRVDLLKKDAKLVMPVRVADVELVVEYLPGRNGLRAGEGGPG